MSREFMLGIDCGGTHTDAALLEVNRDAGIAELRAAAKTLTLHDRLQESIDAVLDSLESEPDAREMLKKTSRATLGTTLAVNALVEGKGDKVGLSLSAGPGLNPEHFVMGENWCIVPGGLDHRGVEIGKLNLQSLRSQAASWRNAGVKAAASVGKFSPRNPAHELEMAAIIRQETGLPVCCGHNLSGKLDFPRRIATAYFNASVQAIHENFLNSVEDSFRSRGIKAQARLLRADGGAIPFTLSRREPVQSILSGPAASVMGTLAMWNGAREGCSLLLDIGGTTTDAAIFLDGSPVVDRLGMRLHGRRTLVRSLASISIGVGGDSSLTPQIDENGHIFIKTGPVRKGSAAAFGGTEATLLDALNFLDRLEDTQDRGDIAASIKAIEFLATGAGNISPSECASLALQNALAQIHEAVHTLINNINAHPIYTLAALRSAKKVEPNRICLAGGPANCLKKHIADALHLPVEISPHPQVANAIGAALTLPTASLEIYADTGKKELTAPGMDYYEKISPAFTLQDVCRKAKNLLEQRLREEGMEYDEVEIANADMFATLDDHGRGAKDMRVTCQAKPGIIATLHG